MPYLCPLTRMGFHTLSNLLIFGICTTTRFGSILPSALRGVSQNEEAWNLRRDDTLPFCQKPAGRRFRDIEEAKLNDTGGVFLLRMRRLFSLSIGLAEGLPLEANRTDWRNGFAIWQPSISRNTADMMVAGVDSSGGVQTK